MKAIRRTKDHDGKPTGNSRSAAASRIPTGSSQATAVDIKGTTIHFPFQPYKCQVDYMEKVLDALNNSENALLESPTGTGKTLCLLCSTLAWQREQGRAILQATQVTQHTSGESNKAPTVPTIIYASRTHSQLSQVVRELRNTRYRPKHAVLGSRQQMCVHPKVKTATATAADINHDCNRLGKDRKCRFRNNLDGFKAPSNEHGASHDTQPVLDMEDLVSMGESSKVCPFYYTRSLVEDAELILVPYNYLFDKDARESTMAEVEWDNAIVIFDEAHNLESFASESASFDLSSVDIGVCIMECTKVGNYLQAQPELQDRVSLDNLIRLKALFLNFEEYILQKIRSDRNVFSGDFMIEIFKEGASINHANHSIFVNEVCKVSDLLMDMRSSSSKGPTKLEFFVGCVKRVFGEISEGRCMAKSRAYRVHITSKPPGNNGMGRVISYWCFAPSLAMQELSNLNIRSIIVTSGTLSPLQSYGMELGLNFKEQLENPHIISDNQIHVRVVGQGVSGKNLSSSYERRSDSEYVTELGNTLVALARIVPAGMLVFFPSYSVMDLCVEGWGGPASQRKNFDKNKKEQNKFFAARQSKKGSSGQFSFPFAPNYYNSSDPNGSMTPWKRLLCQKSIILEPKSTTDLPEAIADFHRYLNQSKSTGCILMGVCRGKISEGIDFAHDMCRAVIVTGLPFAPFLDPKVKLKREYLDGIRAFQSLKASNDGGFGGGDGSALSASISMSGAEWYSQQAHRAVNQAIGRVIRNKLDYGAVLLLDSRFGDPKNTDGLSLWVRTRVQHDHGFGKAIGGLVKFYKDAKCTVDEREKLANAASRAPSGIRLAYEDDLFPTTVKNPTEAFEASVTKITVVQMAAVSNKEINRTDDRVASKRGVTTDDVVENGYVPSNRVIVSYDLRDADGREQSTEDLPHSTVSRAEPLNPVGLGALYSAKAPSSTRNLSSGRRKQDARGGGTSAWESLQSSAASFDSQRDCNTAEKGSIRELDPYTNAQELAPQRTVTNAKAFFDLVKGALSSEDFGSIRKAIVEMKAHGDKKDVRSYLRSASEIISLIVKQDNFETRQGSSEAGMLSLFFSLLPKAYREDAQKIGVKKQLVMSNFGQSCTSFIRNIEERKKLVIEVRLLLNAIYCSTEDTPGVMARSSFAQICKPVVALILEVEIDANVKVASTKQLVESFRWLLPLSLHGTLDGILRDVQAAKNMKRMKAADKARTGEGVVNTARFVVPSAKKPRQEDKKNEMPEEIENRHMLVAGLKMAQDIQRQKREQLEASKLATKSQYGQLKRKVDLALASVSTSSLPSLNRDKLANSLKVAGTDHFVKNVRPIPSESKLVGYNAPEGLTCLVCDSTIRLPFMADCRHLACASCWSQWLQKSSTCPKCRSTVTSGQLTRVVFNTQLDGSKVPTLSQLCKTTPSTNDDEQSSDDELEVIGSQYLE